MISEFPRKLDLNCPDDLDAWARSARHFDKGKHVLDGTHEVGDLMLTVVQGETSWWPGDGASALTEIIIYPRKKVASVFLVCGNLRELKSWLELDGPFDRWAQENECHRAHYVSARPFHKVLDNIVAYGGLYSRDYENGG